MKMQIIRSQTIFKISKFVFQFIRHFSTITCGPKMKIVVSIASALLLFVVPSVSSTALGECKLICKEIRTEVLAAKGHCMPAMKQAPTPNLFNACVEGRKKAFDQACVPICSKTEVSVTSFQACHANVKSKGHKFVSWCRKVCSVLKFSHSRCCLVHFHIHF